VNFGVLALAGLFSAAPVVPFEAEIDAALAGTAHIYPVPKPLVVAVISVESGFGRAPCHVPARRG
jgi:membrane-bound lytic murein transglycosylase B